MGKSKVTIELLGPSRKGTPDADEGKVSNQKKGKIDLFTAARIKRDGEPEFHVGVGDFVLLSPTDDEEPWVARIIDLYANSKKTKVASMQWLYRPKDIPKAARPSNCAKNEVFYALRHVDEVELQSILEPIRLEFWLQKGTQGPILTVKSRLYSDEHLGDPCAFICSRIFDLENTIVPLTLPKFKELERNLPLPLSELVSEDATRVRPERLSSSSGSSHEEKEDEDVDSKHPSKKLKAIKAKKRTMPSGSFSDANALYNEGHKASVMEVETSACRANAETSTPRMRVVEEDQEPGASTTPPSARLNISMHDKENVGDKPETNASKSSGGSDVVVLGDDSFVLSKLDEPENENAETQDGPTSDDKKSDKAVDLMATLAEPEAQSSEKQSTTNNPGMRLMKRLGVREAEPATNDKAVGKRSTKKPKFAGDAEGEKKTESESSIGLIDVALWDIVKDARIAVGVHEAKEVFGYLKLEAVAGNDNRSSDNRIAPPKFIRTRLESAEMAPFVQKAREILRLNQKPLLRQPGGVTRAFAELERIRPGVILGLLGKRDAESFFDCQWLFPNEVVEPVFGSVLGRDGFQTLTVFYKCQRMYVPVELDVSLQEAAKRAISRIVAKDLGFALVHTEGTLEFDLATAPDETSSQVFVKLVTGRTIELNVPVAKSTLGFVRALVCGSEGISHRQLERYKLIVPGIDMGRSNNRTLLRDCGVSDFSTLHLMASGGEDSA